MKQFLPPMKQLNLVFLVLMISMSLSCSDDNNPSISTAIVGKWEATKEVLTGCDDTSRNGTKDCPGFIFCYSFEFKADGTYTRYFTASGTPIDEGGYIIDGPQISIISTGVSEIDYGFQLKGSTELLLTNEDSYPCVYTYHFTKKTN